MGTTGRRRNTGISKSIRISIDVPSRLIYCGVVIDQCIVQLLSIPFPFLSYWETAPSPSLQSVLSDVPSITGFEPMLEHLQNHLRHHRRVKRLINDTGIQVVFQTITIIVLITADLHAIG